VIDFDKATSMKLAVVFIFISLMLASQTFAVLRPRFPVKPEPPLRGGVIVIGDEITQAGKHPQDAKCANAFNRNAKAI
jgi:hypothetical protein